MFLTIFPYLLSIVTVVVFGFDFQSRLYLQLIFLLFLDWMRHCRRFRLWLFRFGIAAIVGSTGSSIAVIFDGLVALQRFGLLLNSRGICILLHLCLPSSLLSPLLDHLVLQPLLTCEFIELFHLAKLLLLFLLLLLRLNSRTILLWLVLIVDSRLPSVVGKLVL